MYHEMGDLSMSKRQKWQNRITGHAEIDPQTLKENPKNWRLHPDKQKKSLAGVLEGVGWVQEIIVNQRTGVLVDGHLRLALALQREEPTVPVKYVDLSPDEEALILATLDPIAAMASADKQKLDALLRGIQTEHKAVGEMLAGLAEESELYLDNLGLKSKEEPEKLEGGVVILTFSDDEHAEFVALVDELKQSLGTATQEQTVLAALELTAKSV